MEKQRIEEEVNKTIELFERSEQIEANPYFFTRLKARIENIKEGDKPNLFGFGFLKQTISNLFTIIYNRFISRFLLWIKAINELPRWKWVVGALTGILIVVSLFYFSQRFSMLESTQSDFELMWNSNMNDSIEALSQSISRLQENPTFLIETTNSATISSTSTLDAEISALKKRINIFSNSLSQYTF